MIEQLLPAGVVVVEAFEDVPGEPVFPGEEDLVVNAVESRRCEFVTARRCAREAVAKLGRVPAPIRRGSNREPLWPPGLVGSITHTTGFRGAAVAPLNIVASVGIDTEQDCALPDGVEAAITVGGELEMLKSLARAFPLTHWGRLLFSAKEAVYKAWYPLTGRWLGFKHACLTIDPAGAFAATLLIDGSRTDGKPPLTELQGRFLIAQGLVATAVTVPPNAAVECAESSAATLGADSPADISGQLIPHCLISAHDRFPGRVADPHGCPAGVSLAPGADLKL